jgi:hypothetical protein
LDASLTRGELLVWLPSSAPKVKMRLPCHLSLLRCFSTYFDAVNNKDPEEVFCMTGLDSTPWLIRAAWNPPSEEGHARVSCSGTWRTRSALKSACSEGVAAQSRYFGKNNVRTGQACDTSKSSPWDAHSLAECRSLAGSMMECAWPYPSQSPTL